MKKVIFSLLLCYSFHLTAADFMHDIGLGFWTKLRNTANGQPTSYGPSVQYMPRLNFPIKDKMAISIASPVGLGARFHPYEGNFFQMQLPVTLLFNFGHAAYKNENHHGNVGGYFGTGFSYVLSASETLRESDYGLMSLGGLRFYTHHHSMGLHIFHTHDFRYKNNYLGAGFFYTFGYFN